VLAPQVLEADLRCIAPLMPETFAACERSTPDIHLFVSVRVVQVCSGLSRARTCMPARGGADGFPPACSPRVCCALG